MPKVTAKPRKEPRATLKMFQNISSNPFRRGNRIKSEDNESELRKREKGSLKSGKKKKQKDQHQKKILKRKRRRVDPVSTTSQAPIIDPPPPAIVEELPELLELLIPVDKHLDPLRNITSQATRNLIFQHFTGADVLNVFTLSKSWSKAASASTQAMSKITLVVDEKRMEQPFNVFPLFNTTRPYRKLFFRVINNQDYKTKHKFLLKVAPNLRELSFENTHGSFFYNLIKDLKVGLKFSYPDLSSLKVLKLRVANHEDARTLLASTNDSLETIEIDTGAQRVFEEKIDLSIAPYLVNLRLGGNFFTQNYRHRPTTANFKNFLKERASTLTFLKVELYASDLPFVINELQNLQTLHLNLMQSANSARTIHLDPHARITTLIHQGRMEEKIYSTLIDALDDLRIVKQFFITKDEFVSLVHRVKALRHVVFVQVVGTNEDLKDIYREMKKENKKVKRQIQIIKVDPESWHDESSYVTATKVLSQPRRIKL